MDMTTHELIGTIIVIIASAISVTDAICVGTPYPCDFSEKSVCEGVQGCQWISTGTAFYDGYCDGTPSPCSLFSDKPRSSCLDQGCEYQADPPPTTAPTPTTAPMPTTAPGEQTQQPIEPVETTTGSFCTGTPHQCVGGTNSICEAIWGCQWISTGSATWDGYCEGTPTPCSQFSDEPRLSCLAQGCAYQVGDTSDFLCTGTPFPTPACTGTPDPYDSCSPSEKRICEGILGCEWISTGSATWDGYCTGSPTPCNQLSDDGASCIRQLGCTYLKDPPNPEESFYDAIMPLDLDFVCQFPVDLYTWNDTLGQNIWIGTKIVGDKCQPSSDGYVCYTEVSFWSLSGDYGGLGLVSHNNVMKIGEDYCDSEFCDDGTTAFNCEKVVTVNDPNGRVVGHDCSGNCIWKMPTASGDTESPTPGPISTPGPAPGPTPDPVTPASTLSPTPGQSVPAPTNMNDIATETPIPTPATDIDSGAEPLFQKTLISLGLGSMLILY